MTEYVKVRIAVAVGEIGEWVAVGSDGQSDASAVDEAFYSFAKGTCTAYFVTAELPIPEVKEIPGTVEKADE